jgi:hypothetical protein
MRSDAWFTSDEIAGEAGLERASAVVFAVGVTKSPSHRSKMVLTSSKQASCLAWADCSSSLGSLGTKWVIRLSMAFEIRLRWLWAMVAL